MIPNLGTRNANIRAGVATRITALECAIGRVASRTLNGATGYTTLRRVAKTGHGWSVGTWVKLLSGNWSAAATGSTLTADAIGVVLNVADADTVEVVIDGLVQVAGSSYTAATLYYLSTSSGVATSTKPAVPNVVQPLFVALGNGWIALFGQAAVVSRSMNVSDLRDVTLTSLAYGNTLRWDGSSWINFDTKLDGGLSDVQLTAVSDQQVLSYDNASGKWINRTLSAVTSLAMGGDVTGTTAASTVAKIRGTNVLITSLTTLDFLQYDGTNWINVNLGEIDWSPTDRLLALDGGVGASAASVVAVGATNSRIMIGGGTGLDFLLTGTVAAGNDKSARIQPVSTTEIGFYDQATGAMGTGTKVLSWNCSATAGSRSFDFLTTKVKGSNVEFTGGAITGITDLAVADGGTGASDVANFSANLKAMIYDVSTATTRYTTAGSGTHTFNVASKSYIAIIVGAGGAGSGGSVGVANGSFAGNGGGGGEMVVVWGKVTAATMSYTVGAGAGSTDGGDSTFNGVVAGGGKKSPGASVGPGRGGSYALYQAPYTGATSNANYFMLRFAGRPGQNGSMNYFISSTNYYCSSGEGGEAFISDGTTVTAYGRGGFGPGQGSTFSNPGADGVIYVFEK